MTASTTPAAQPDLDRALASFHPVFAAPIDIAAYQARLSALQIHIRAAELAAVWLDGSTSLTYFTGLQLGQSERIHGVLIPAEGPPAYLTPSFEAPKLDRLRQIPGPMLMWEEDEDPFALVARHLGGLPGRGLGLDPATPFRFASEMIAAMEGRVVSAAGMIAELRQIKSAEEIAIIQAAMDASWKVQRAVNGGLRAGITTTEVGQFIDAAHRASGMAPLFHAVQFGEATAYPHGVPDPQTLRDGDMVLVDMGGTLHGYRSDITRSYVFGAPTARQRQLWQIEHAAHAAAFAATRNGAPCGAVDAAARAVIVAAGFGPGHAVPGLPHRTGHGLGLDIHEEPWIVKGNRTPLQPGMCFSIEPMLCLYGECGIRLEDIVHMTADGPRWFTPPALDLDRPFG
ncbi:M24 family metallopeptidase [Paracoccus benzoatiresistens]|uniref:Xaa-Pro peptidase family protein n=1 Tax=Paracoccus benzoatiresistens TaxID=2997341 RepID=A0ABT4J7S4_9RHOB|nr:Xaa-Pro peptidase family protein [Paracoccus sp. EF6]MCZ0963136.1 Xaa-Pro peptidase family protein [Paracoccus sp. EF6]